MNMIKDGIHYDQSPREYHSWKFHKEAGPISTSILKRFINEGPKGVLKIQDPAFSPALMWGSLVDTLNFTPNDFPTEFVMASECDDLSDDGSFRKKAAREWRDAILAGGQMIVTDEQFEAATDAVKVLRSTPVSARLLEGARYQTALVYTGAHGIPAKGLVDCIPQGASGDAIVDLKTTSANIYNDDELARSVFKYGYHLQASFYLFLWNRLADKPRKRWEIIWQSSKPPYEVRVTELDNLTLDAGEEMVREYFERLVRRIKTGAWDSPFRDKKTMLRIHTPSVFAEEQRLELMQELEA